MGQHGGGVTTPPMRWPNSVANVATNSRQELIQLMSQREPTNDDAIYNSNKEARRHKAHWQCFTSRPLVILADILGETHRFVETQCEVPRIVLSEFIYRIHERTLVS